MNWHTLRPWLGALARIVLGAVFIWASIAKLHDPRRFLQGVRAYDATPEWLSKAIGYGLPVLELCLGILLVVGVVMRMSSIVATVLLVVFLIGMLQAAARGLKIDCGCVGTGGETLRTHYTIDTLYTVGLLVLAVYLVLWSSTRWSLDEFLARHDYVEPPSAKRMRTEEGRRKYQALLDSKRKDAWERALWVNGSLAVVVALVSLIGIGVQANRAKITGSLTATNATVSGGVVFGKAAAATVDLYEDFQCPGCQRLEQQLQTTLDADVRANRAQVHFHPIAIFDSSSTNDYSSRAANAALCASDVSVDTFVSYYNYLFRPGTQPPTGRGRSNAQLAGYAAKVGVPKAQRTTFDQCVFEQTHKSLVEAMTEDASQRGILSAPTLKVNGKTIPATLGAYEAAVAAALKHGPAPQPSPTPTPSTSSATASVAPSPSPSSSSPRASGSPKK